ncbi:DUF983 domain-containing protein [Hyphobacterium sp.]|uniref:DUF983 domain-containing protein n=1 Tax=Hyphobacterium sp. TaxID=2004662 RepID=UPI003B52D3F3
MPDGRRLTLMTACRRGLSMRCPSCGQAPLYRAYLKPVDRCPNCGADFTAIRADDGPAWLTVLSLGPLMAPLAFWIALSGWPALVTYPALAALIIGAVLLWLPRMKGVFIAALYVNRMSGR